MCSNLQISRLYFCPMRERDSRPPQDSPNQVVDTYGFLLVQEIDDEADAIDEGNYCSCEDGRDAFIGAVYMRDLVSQHELRRLFVRAGVAMDLDLDNAAERVFDQVKHEKFRWRQARKNVSQRLSEYEKVSARFLSTPTDEELFIAAHTALLRLAYALDVIN